MSQVHSVTHVPVHSIPHPLRIEADACWIPRWWIIPYDGGPAIAFSLGVNVRSRALEIVAFRKAFLENTIGVDFPEPAFIPPGAEEWFCFAGRRLPILAWPFQAMTRRVFVPASDSRRDQPACTIS
jgi:hypothetical protein